MIFNESQKNTCKVELDEELVFNYNINLNLNFIVFIINTFVFIVQYLYYNYIKNILLIIFVLLVELLIITLFWIIAYLFVLKNIPFIKSIIDS
jgi:hypothetical protein